MYTHPHPPLCSQLLPLDVTVVRSFFRFPFHPSPLQTVDSLSNRKQMGDLCCGLLPNGANSHYNVCKLCLFSPSFTSTPRNILPSDVFRTCFRCRHVILICLLLLIAGYHLGFSAPNGKHFVHNYSVGLLSVRFYLSNKKLVSPKHQFYINCQKQYSKIQFVKL